MATSKKVPLKSKIITAKAVKSVKVVKAESKPTVKVRSVSLSIPLFTTDGKSTTTLNLPKELFAVEAKKSLLAQYVRVYLANQRQGTAATKTRAEVVGSTRKIYKQKGTGRARHGSKKANLFKGGGVTFGSQPRDFSLNINKKQKRLALLYSLTLKAQEKNILGLDNKMLDTKPKTKLVVTLLKAMGNQDKKTLLLVPDMKKNNLSLAARNIPNVEVMMANTINPYAVLTHESLILVEDAVKVLSSHFGKK